MRKKLFLISVRNMTAQSYSQTPVFIKNQVLEQVCYTPIAATHFPLIPQDAVYCFRLVCAKN